MSRLRTIWLPSLLSMLIVAPRAFAPLRDTDTGWHLAVGRTILQSGMMHTNALSWTATDFPWYPTSWLYDVACWLTVSMTGVLGLQVFHFLLLAGTILALALACSFVHPTRGAWAIVAVALLLLPRIVERPHVATWLIMAVVLALCLGAKNLTPLALRASPPLPILGSGSGGNGNQIAEIDEALPRMGRAGDARSASGLGLRAACLPILVLGANLHSGAAFPVAIFALFCAEAAVRERQWKREGILIALGGLAFLANPGGLFNVLYLVQHLFVQEVVKLGEFERPTLVRAPLFFATVALALAAAWSSRRRHPVFLPLTILFAGLGCYALRLVYEFSIVAAPVIAGGLPWIEARGRRLETVAIALCVTVTLAARERYWSTIEFGARFDEKTIPVGAAKFLSNEPLPGHGFNAFRDGGYLEYAVPNFRAFQDARVQAYPEDFFRIEKAAQQSPEAFQTYLRSHDIAWAVASRVKEDLAGWNQFGPTEWALIFWDSASEVFVRRDESSLAHVIARREFKVFRPGVPLETVAKWPNESAEVLLAEATRAQSERGDSGEIATARCAALTRLGRSEAASVCSHAVDIADESESRVLERIAVSRK